MSELCLCSFCDSGEDVFAVGINEDLPWVFACHDCLHGLMFMRDAIGPDLHKYTFEPITLDGKPRDQVDAVSEAIRIIEDAS